MKHFKAGNGQMIVMNFKYDYMKIL